MGIGGDASDADSSAGEVYSDRYSREDRSAAANRPAGTAQCRYHKSANLICDEVNNRRCINQARDVTITKLSRSI